MRKIILSAFIGLSLLAANVTMAAPTLSRISDRTETSVSGMLVIATDDDSESD
jgi:hypothetical protein